MKAAIYSCVSTEGQEQGETSLETQMEAYSKLLEAGIYYHCTNMGMSAFS